MTSPNVRTTITLPQELLEATDMMVSQGKVKSRNELIALALKNELAARNRAEIDSALAEMAQDPDYHTEVLKSYLRVFIHSRHCERSEAI